ncbi:MULTISPECIES: hypothetical protein [Paenibacillus]|uniref:Uncharacterized protein n=2 Tax=Paenibacillus TaxID=44249 RepID=A0ABX2ZBL8_PAEPO|nr:MULTISPECIES: hypothetical protein [Paenibacillus]MDR6779508.1 hypothetical protein [Paenibacillus peoriae]ODA08226.1 hypothetical protein A7312_27865 [Paenibacillus polymyxa]
MKFYGIAVNTQNKSAVINNLPTDYLGAVKEAKRIAIKQGLKYQFVKPAVNGQKEGATLTKFAAQRKNRKSVKR